jgi:hypothetical protein
MKIGLFLIVLLVFGAIYAGSTEFFAAYTPLTGILSLLLSFVVSGVLSFALLLGLWAWAGVNAARR